MFQSSLAVFFVVDPLPRVRAAIWISIGTMTMDPASNPLAIIVRSILPNLLPVSISLLVQPLSFVCHSFGNCDPFPQFPDCILVIMNHHRGLCPSERCFRTRFCSLFAEARSLSFGVQCVLAVLFPVIGLAPTILF